MTLGSNPGISIVSRHPDGQNCDEFARVVTGPPRAHNPLELDAAYDWTAEQEVETSPREFQFVTTCADYRSAFAVLEAMLWPRNEKQFEEAGKKSEMLRTG